MEEVEADSIEGINDIVQTESLCDERAIFVNEKPRRGAASPNCPTVQMKKPACDLSAAKFRELGSAIAQVGLVGSVAPLPQGVQFTIYGVDRALRRDRALRWDFYVF